jgi:hypothetical protein
MILSIMIATAIREQISNGYIIGPPLIKKVHMDYTSSKSFYYSIKNPRPLKATGDVIPLPSRPYLRRPLREA